MRARYTDEQRRIAFWSKVDTNGPVPNFRPDLGPCFLWTAFCDPRGYGSFGVGGQRTIAAHLFIIGKAPAGLEWDHLCRVHACVRPSHLEAVTHQENTRRGLAGSLRTHCTHGHAFDEANTFVTKAGARGCRTCKRTRDRRRWGKKVAA